MARDTKKVTDAELSVLEVLWAEGESTIRVIADRLYPGGKASDYSTVQKLLDRLERKACVVRDRSGYAHVFRTEIERSALVGQQLEQVASRLCDGSMTPLLMHLVSHQKLSDSERAQLRSMLDSSESATDPSREEPHR